MVLAKVKFWYCSLGRIKNIWPWERVWCLLSMLQCVLVSLEKLWYSNGLMCSLQPWAWDYYLHCCWLHGWVVTLCAIVVLTLLIIFIIVFGSRARGFVMIPSCRLTRVKFFLFKFWGEWRGVVLTCVRWGNFGGAGECGIWWFILDGTVVQ